MQGFKVLEQIANGAHFVKLSPARFAKMQALNTARVVLESTNTSKVHGRTYILSRTETIQLKSKIRFLGGIA